eukprot:8210730-Alexandrium_andersonii.AAC.1
MQWSRSVGQGGLAVAGGRRWGSLGRVKWRTRAQANAVVSQRGAGRQLGFPGQVGGGGGAGPSQVAHACAGGSSGLAAWGRAAWRWQVGGGGGAGPSQVTHACAGECSGLA